MFGTLAVIFNHVDALEELYVTKNAVYSKHELDRTANLPIMRNSLLTMETDDPAYKLKRKTLSSAFQKSKMDRMVKSIKNTTLKVFSDLQAQGDVNEVDINAFTSDV